MNHHELHEMELSVTLGPEHTLATFTRWLKLSTIFPMSVSTLCKSVFCFCAAAAVAAAVGPLPLANAAAPTPLFIICK